MIIVALPYPVSANMYWRPVMIGGHSTIVPTKKAKDYKAEVASHCLAAGIRRPIQGRVSLEIALYPHRPQDWAKRVKTLGPELWDDTVQCIDLGNCEKVLCDALEGIAYDNDRQNLGDKASSNGA